MCACCAKTPPYVCCETRTLSWVYGGTFRVSVCYRASILAPHVLRPLLPFLMELSIGDRVFYTICYLNYVQNYYSPYAYGVQNSGP